MEKILSVLFLASSLLLNGCNAGGASSSNTAAPNGFGSLSNNDNSAGITWSAPVVLDEQSTGSDGQSLAVDAGGNVYALWRQMQNGDSMLIVRTHTQDWDAPVTLASGSIGTPTSIAAGADGNAIAGWSQTDQFKNNNAHTRAFTGGAWGTPQRLNALSSYQQGGLPPGIPCGCAANHSSPILALAPNGQMAAVWQGDLSTSDDIQIARMARGTLSTGWGPASLDGSRAPYSLNVAINAQGDAAMAFPQDTDGGADFSWFGNYSPRGTTSWVNSFHVEGSGNTSPTSPVQIAISPEPGMGAIYVFAYATYPPSTSSGQHIYSARVYQGPLEQLNDNPNSDKPQMGTDASGNALLIWRQLEGSQHTLRSLRYVAGAWQQLSTGLPADADVDNPVVAVAADGSAAAAWERHGADGAHIYISRFTAGSGWSAQQRVDTAAADATNPRIVVDAQGHATIVWQQGINGVTHLLAARFE